MAAADLVSWRQFGADIRNGALGLLGGISRDSWVGLGISLAKTAAIGLALFLAIRLLRFALARLEASFNRWDLPRAGDSSLSDLFRGVHRVLVVTGWMMLVVFAGRIFSVPAVLVDGLLRLVRAYFVVAAGLLVIRSSIVIVDTIDALSDRYARDRGWAHYYDHLRPLVPTFRACLEYGLWVAVASLTLLQLGAGRFAGWGPLAIEAIGIFFLGRVAIELGRLEIDRRVLPEEGLDDMTRRRRQTIVPLVRTGFTYAVYFGVCVLILASLGFNPLPFLAGAGILGLVVGFGAQSLINDVVSGFFILFENTYLVGDAIEAAGARGVVESIEFRTTKIRDAEGRQHIIRNGDVKEVINYSKDYTLAVVPVDVVYEADLRNVFSVLREAGERLRAENADVLAETQIDGIVAFGPSTMTVRTSTRVRPGRHDAAAAALRLAIKEAFDLRGAGAGRRGLVPAGFGSPAATPSRNHVGTEQRVANVGDRRRTST